MTDWILRVFSRRRARRRCVPRPSIRPMLLALEERVVPTTWTVYNAGDDGQNGCLRSQIANASSGDTINFLSTLKGAIIELNSEIQITKNLTITGTAANGAVVNPTISGCDANRIFEIISGTTSINNLTFSSGEVTGDDGGAIAVDSGTTLTLSTDTFTGNYAYEDSQKNFGDGGALQNYGILSVSGCTFTGSYADNYGGAINSSSSAGAGSLTVQNSTFTDGCATNGGAISSSDTTTLSNDTFGGSGSGQGNFTLGSAGNGGAVYAMGSLATTNLTVSGSTFTSNMADSGGGAILTDDVTSVTTSTFTSNTASGGGGALYYLVSSAPSDSSLQLNLSTFTSNSSFAGGALFCVVNISSGTVVESITNSTFYDNTTGTGSYGGGAELNNTVSGTGSVQASLINDTFFDNSSGSHGGGLAVLLSTGGTGGNTVALTSLTVYDNSASLDSGGLYVDGPAGGAVTVDNNIFDGNTVTASGYDGPVDVTLTNAGVLSDSGYNLVGTSDTMFSTTRKDILNNNPGLADSLALNGAPAGFPLTLALSTTSPGYRKGDQGLASKGSPNNIDERGFTRLNGKVSIGAEDPDATNNQQQDMLSGP